jgi:peroxiredoxin
MKKTFLLAFIILGFSCKKKDDSKSITIDVIGIDKHFSIKLDSIDFENNSFKVDSLKGSTLNKFQIPPSKYPKQYQLKIINDSLKQTVLYLPVWFENENIVVSGKLKDLESFRVKGGELNNIQFKFNSILEKHSIAIENDFLKAKNESEKDSIFDNYVKRIKKDQIYFIFKNPNNLLSLSNMIRLSGNVSKDSLGLYYKLLDTDLQSSKKGQILFEQKNVQKLKVGDIIQNFTAKDLNDKEISLFDFKGKILLLDFWASWCVPCHEQNQKEFSQLHKKYGKDNLVIISYSLDKIKDKEKWKEASLNDGITWVNISNLKGFNDPISKQYNISAIPNSFLIDQNGVIVKSFLGYNDGDQLIEKEILKLMN